MSRLISSRVGQQLYILRHYAEVDWLTTLATSRKKCWESVTHIDSPEVLKKNGWKCVAITLAEKK